MTTKRIRKLATVAATAALAVQMFAGTASAAVPPATPGGIAYGNNGTDLLAGTFGGDGYAGFRTTFQAGAGVNLSKLFFEADIHTAAGATVPVLVVTRAGANAAKDCSVQASPLAVKCQFKTVRDSDPIVIDFGVKTSGTSVTTEGLWSSSGFVEGGNNSHGDAWSSGAMSSTNGGNADFAAGFGNTTLSTQTSNNKQSAKLTGLPASKFASVNDNGGPDGVGFSVINISVNGGAAANFQLVVTYPKPTSAPKSYFHFGSTGFADTEYFLCGKGQTVNCFTWDKKTYTATIFLGHNGSLRRTS